MRLCIRIQGVLALNIRTRLYEWRTRHDLLSVQMRRMFTA